MKTRVWDRRLIINYSKKIYEISKKGSEEIFVGYIYLELSKKILFHHTGPLTVYSQRILRSRG
jgi:hypothetical protein